MSPAGRESLDLGYSRQVIKIKKERYSQSRIGTQNLSWLGWYNYLPCDRGDIVALIGS